MATATVLIVDPDQCVVPSMFLVTHYAVPRQVDEYDMGAFGEGFACDLRAWLDEETRLEAVLGRGYWSNESRNAVQRAVLTGGEEPIEWRVPALP